MNRNKDCWTLQEVFHIMLYGTDEEKQEVLTSMVHATNIVIVSRIQLLLEKAPVKDALLQAQ